VLIGKYASKRANTLRFGSSLDLPPSPGWRGCVRRHDARQLVDRRLPTVDPPRH
jgi:hypothetical protein